MARITVETLIKNVVDKLRASRTGAISSVVKNGNEYTLNTLKTFDIEKGNFISVLGFSVYVIEVVENVSIKVETSNDLITAVKWEALQPYFYYGDPIDMNNEITAGSNDQDTKYPAVIMFEVKRSKYSIQRSDLIDFTPRLRLFFMDQANYSDSTINDLYKTVDSMQDLAEEFINQLGITPHIYVQDSDYNLNKHSKWGVKVIRNGKTNAETLFDNNLTGVEIEIDVPIAKSLQFSCLC
jgi:hypothetical protein